MPITESKKGIYFAEGSPSRVIDSHEASQLVDSLITGIEEAHGSLSRVLLIPPDITRLHSGAGELTRLLFSKLSSRTHVEIMPAVGTHFAMTPEQISTMYPGIPMERFRAHRWRQDVVPMGEVPESLVEEISEGRLRFPISSAVNRSLVDGNWDRIISIGQLVPHELAGIANFSKNILIGVGGPDTIAKSHYLAAVYGLERLMGQIESPMRRMLSYMEEHCIRSLPITYLMTVRGTENGAFVTRGLFAGETSEIYDVGAKLCQQVSITKVDKRAEKVVAYMDPQEYHSTWVGNKAIYRTRMVVADGGELVVIAPGVRQFGEDQENDDLIRRVGYRTTEEMINLVAEDPAVAENLTAVSHIIVSSPDDRFRITYAPGKLSRKETQDARLSYADPSKLLERYDPKQLSEGWNTLPDGEEVFFVSQPASGLWMGP